MVNSFFLLTFIKKCRLNRDEKPRHKNRGIILATLISFTSRKLKPIAAMSRLPVADISVMISVVSISLIISGTQSNHAFIQENRHRREGYAYSHADANMTETTPSRIDFA